MEEKELICPICGNPTSSYMGNNRKDRLCKKHSIMLKNGEISCDANGVYFDNKGKQLNGEIKESKTEILTRNKHDKCIICGKESKGKPLCLDCYHDCQEIEDDLDRNKKPFELKDYYFNLKSANMRVVKRDTIILNIKKMYALANICMDSYDDTSLISRVNNDAMEIITYTNKKKEIKETNYTEQSDSQKSAIIRTFDGHIVKSEGERIIDDILYNNGYVHAYEKEVVEISSELRCIKSDFFVPFRANKGVYIEYWGMNTKEYLANKEEKKKMYREHNIPLIDIEKDEIKDPAGLDARIQREIKKYKEEWKKSL